MLVRSANLRNLFKLPGRKSLDTVMKMDLLLLLPAPQIINLWVQHHSQLLQYWGRVISNDAYIQMQQRLRQCPYFCVPVFRKTCLFNAVTCFDRDVVGVAPLREWQDKEDSCTPHLLIQFFTELASTKGIVLIRAELKDEVFTKEDSAFICGMLMKYYIEPNKYEQWVHAFNKNPHIFDYTAFLHSMKQETDTNITIHKGKKGS